MSALFRCGGGVGSYKCVAIIKSYTESYETTRDCLLVASATGSSGGTALNNCTPTVTGGEATLIDDYNIFTSGYDGIIPATAIYLCKPTGGTMSIKFNQSPKVAMIFEKG